MQIRESLIRAMEAEISLQKDYFEGDEAGTIYFGGGTPSLLDATEIGHLLQEIARVHTISANAEITLEANPDDLSLRKLRDLKSVGINRLSIGIQSFDNAILSQLNRSHSSENAIQCVGDARSAGFDNISIDLIYAIPGLTPGNWEKTIRLALDLETQHISAYTLTIEPRTVFGNWVKKGKIVPVDEGAAATQMNTLVAMLAAQGYRQYEISNFALAGFESVHNSNYWKGSKYLGIGPSAHSYNGRSRQHNISNNHLYVSAIKDNKIPAEEESLKKEEQINEYILTSLRTDAGCDLDFLNQTFGYDVRSLYALYLSRLQSDSLARLDHNRLILTDTGKLLADTISSDLFLIE